jgi:hypothetical protein
MYSGTCFDEKNGRVLGVGADGDGLATPQAPAIPPFERDIVDRDITVDDERIHAVGARARPIRSVHYSCRAIPDLDQENSGAPTGRGREDPVLRPAVPEASSAKGACPEAASNSTLTTQSCSAACPRIICARCLRGVASLSWTLTEAEQALRIEVRDLLLLMRVDGHLVKK